MYTVFLLPSFHLQYLVAQDKSDLGSDQSLIRHCLSKYCNPLSVTALVAQMDGHPTGDQKVAEWTPAGSATFFHGD